MKIYCSRQDLMKSVNIALRAVPVRTTMPILECILIDARPGEIHFISNDMELGIDTVVNGVTEEPGVIAVNAKLFSEIVRKLPDSSVTITSDANYGVTIVCDKAHFALAGQSGEEFAYLPEVERDERIEISQYTLREIITDTIFSVSQNENNRLMTGELFEVRGDRLRVIALDGHRISIRRVNLKEIYSDASVVVPGKALSEVTKIMTGETEDMAGIYVTPGHIVFEIPGTTVISRLIEGSYFAVDQMISSDYETKVTINRQTFLSCIDRATLFVRENDKKPVILDFQDRDLVLSINSPLGSMKEDIYIEKEGRDLMIGFNPRFLMDALKAIDDENVTLYMTNAKSPCFIRDESLSYTYLILPVNFTR